MMDKEDECYRCGNYIPIEDRFDDELCHDCYHDPNLFVEIGFSPVEIEDDQRSYVTQKT